MPKDYNDITHSVSRSLKRLRAHKPDVVRGFDALAEAAMRDGVLNKKTKELIALALGVSARCDACLGFHAKALVKLGATREEIEEAIGVAVYMGGGPSLMYAADALTAFEQAETPSSPLDRIDAPDTQRFQEEGASARE